MASMKKLPMKGKLIPVRPGNPVKPGERVSPTKPGINYRQAASKPKPTPYDFPPAEGFGGYDSKTNRLLPMKTPIVKKAPKRVSVTRRGGK
jgi:hypothetical protein